MYISWTEIALLVSVCGGSPFSCPLNQLGFAYLCAHDQWSRFGPGVTWCRIEKKRKKKEAAAVDIKAEFAPSVNIKYRCYFYDILYIYTRI